LTRKVRDKIWDIEAAKATTKKTEQTNYELSKEKGAGTSSIKRKKEAEKGKEGQLRGEDKMKRGKNSRNLGHFSDAET